MLRALRRHNPGRSLSGLLLYEFCWHLCWLGLTLFYRLRCFGSQHVPADGAFLVVVNHQSHFDPVLAGMAMRRRHLNFLARSTLFKNPLFGGLIARLNAVPLKQGEGDRGAIRTSLEQLAEGRAMLVFPEGSRTGDGRMHQFKRGAWLLMSKAGCPILPVAVEGAYDTWKRGSPLPRLFGRRIAVRIGPPIPAQTLLAMPADEGLRYLARVVDDLRQSLVEPLERSGMRLTTGPFIDAEEPEPPASPPPGHVATGQSQPVG
ncbi:MAG: 1-acyl-sn-glycerol-3-phosphate acyltransferase [Phycisphaeraceae bacterium]|nr:1-acyl-sn-glycerol-3-phosphate acyltransferase [Phycisphaeraceae bacterium]